MPTFSYNPSFVAGSVDYVRFRVGDTSSVPQWFLANESIQSLINLYPGQMDEVCAVCCETIGMIANQQGSLIQVGDIKQQFLDRAKNAFALAKEIRSNAQPAPGDPVNPGALSGCVPDCDLERYDHELRDCWPLDEFGYQGGR